MSLDEVFHRHDLPDEMGLTYQHVLAEALVSCRRIHKELGEGEGVTALLERSTKTTEGMPSHWNIWPAARHIEYCMPLILVTSATASCGSSAQ